VADNLPVNIRLELMGIAALLATVACDNPSDPKHLGVSLNKNGRTVVHYQPCPGERVTRVRLIEVHGDSPYDGDDRTLWAIRAHRSGSTASFTVGDTPPGYVERVALREPLPDSYFVAQISASSGAEVANGFSPRELSARTVHVADGDILTRADFRARALEDCPPR
jgi:hypothetical protein